MPGAKNDKQQGGRPRYWSCLYKKVYLQLFPAQFHDFIIFRLRIELWLFVGFNTIVIIGDTRIPQRSDTHIIY